MIDPNAHIAIVGLGVSGRAVRDALEGYNLSLWDQRGAEVGARDLVLDDLLAAAPDIVVIAPGIAATGEIYTGLVSAGITPWSEIELAWHLRAKREGGYAPWLVVTGTNGKTTTVTMTSAMLTQAGFNAPAVGNVGQPLIAAAMDPSIDVLPIELSSFQLHSTYSMSPLAAGVLNIAADHLDWHGSMEGYAADKARAYHQVQKACFYPVGDAQVQAMVDEADVVEGAKAIGLTTGIPAPGMIGIVDGVVCERAFGPERFRAARELFTLDDVAHLGPGKVPDHVLADAMMAAGLARAFDIDPVHIRDALRAFGAGSHRIEVVAETDGVTWVDDSKATNAHAAMASLLSQKDGSVVWIAGGMAKGAEFTELMAAVAPKLKAMVLIGAHQDEFLHAHEVAGSGVPLTVIPPGSANVMREAVEAARQHADSGDVVMLAPACASWDQFESYADRGDQFAAAAGRLE